MAAEAETLMRNENAVGSFPHQKEQHLPGVLAVVSLAGGPDGPVLVYTNEALPPPPPPPAGKGKQVARWCTVTGSFSFYSSARLSC